MPIVAKLDELGRPAWILLMILGFMWWWPVGLMILAFIIGSGRMGCGYHGDRWERKMERLQDKMERMRGHMEGRSDWWGCHQLQRQPRLRRIPHRDAQAPGGRAARIPGLPGTPAPGQGQGGIRSVHGGTAQPAAGAAPSASLSYVAASASNSRPPAITAGGLCRCGEALPACRFAQSVRPWSLSHGLLAGALTRR